MLILGLNMFHADSSAAIVEDGKILFAVAEERLNRHKHYGGFPALAVKACLEFAGAKIGDVQHVAVGQDSDANLAKKVQYALANPAKVLNFIKMRQRKESMRDVRSLLAHALDVDLSALKFQEHHLEHHIAHIASAYYCSPWQKAAGFSYDGSGDFVSTMMARCEGSEIHVLDRVFLPHSLGSFYTMICDFIGYRKYGDEGKVMGLAPYGKDTYVDQIRKVAALKNGSFQLNMSYFKPLGSSQGMQVLPDGTVRLARHFSSKMENLFGAPREPHAEISQRDMDLAYAMQHIFEEVFFHLANELHKRVPEENLAMAGGCALNSVANGKLFLRTPFRRTWIQPAAGDEGLAIGAALHTYHAVLKHPRRKEQQINPAYLGPEFSEPRIESALKRADIKYRHLDRAPLLDAVSDQMAKGNVVGWFQGRMEWGPRALGNRSIVTHPGLPNMKDVLNARIKHREWFRPFAPSILAEA
ncbi:MAG: carbamoyltransferase N-terminal domain-containing protein, partial [Terriglobales bacterium]